MQRQTNGTSFHFTAQVYEKSIKPILIEKQVAPSSDTIEISINKAKAQGVRVTFSNNHFVTVPIDRKTTVRKQAGKR